MKPTKRTTVASLILAVLLSSAIPSYAEHASHETKMMDASSKIAQTDAALRDLWVGHAFWVRNVAVETIAGNTAAAAVAENEVVANAKLIAAAIEPFYGKAASDKLFELLAGHYGAVKQYLDATVAGSKAKQDAATKNAVSNAVEISKFLSGANPNLPFDALNGLLVAHYGHHVQQFQQLKDQQYTEEAQTWEEMKKHMYGIADALTGALEKQFPSKFR